MRRLAPLLALMLWPAVAVSQDAQPLQDSGTVLVIDTTQLLAESRYAAALFADIEKIAADLQAENQRIVDDLVAEEQSLTEQRATMEPEEFRAAAEAFDAKAQEIRRNRDAKEVELEDMRRNARVQFLREARTIVGQLMVERGATVVLDNRSVYVTIIPSDITKEAIARIDAAFLTQTNETGSDD